MPHAIPGRRDFLCSAAAIAGGAFLPYWQVCKGAEEKPKLKVYMHWDMEGTSGLFKREQVWYWEPGVSKEAAAAGTALLIADVNSAVAAALKAGADKVIVCDTHHGGGNIRPAEMLDDPRVTYHVRSRRREGSGMRWMPDMDETISGLMLMGHHGKAGTEHAFLPHTWQLDWADFRINGQSLGEIGIEACFAGHWNVPPVLVHGDEAVCKEAEGVFPGVVTACVKRAESPDLATGLPAEQARGLTAEKVAEAVKRLQTSRPAAYRPSLPLQVAIRMKSEKAAQAAAQKPGARLVDATTVEYEAKRYCDVVNWIVGAGIVE